jgi:hypothetical protein
MEGGTMAEKPILFNGEMVRATLDGRKTQTRRPIRASGSVIETRASIEHYHAPSYKTGDTLWVRETWGIADMWLTPEAALAEFYGDEDSAVYTGKVPGRYDVADLAAHVVYRASMDREYHWRPSIHMPRWASRITLEVTDVRAERVGAISAADLLAEGADWFIGSTEYTSPNEKRLAWFSNTWDAIYAKRGLGWDANPWVWAYTFRVVNDGR